MGIRAGLIAALLALAPVGAAAECREDRVDLRWDGGSARFTVEIAETSDEQARGLMFRERMARNAGMLFVYPFPRETAFWMRNTLIPLDMVFVDAEGRVVRVHDSAIPGDETPIPSGAPVVAVLEINGGLSKRLGLGEGAELRSPFIPQDGAAWPCEGDAG